MPKVDYNRANTLQQLGRVEEAVTSYRRAIAQNPLDLVAHSDLNGALYRLGKDDEFLRSYDESFARHPTEGQLPLAKASFLFQKEDFDLARESYEIAGRLLPDNITPHDALGMIFARKNEFARAIREHETAIAMEPANAHAWLNFAETLFDPAIPSAR
jgi:tetratricopeptide (TPR) repeat protein